VKTQLAGERLASVPKRAQELTRAEVVAELRRIAAQLDRPLCATDLADNLRFTVQRFYGSIDAARDDAKLPHPETPRTAGRARS